MAFPVVDNLWAGCTLSVFRVLFCNYLNRKGLSPKSCLHVKYFSSRGFVVLQNNKFDVVHTLRRSSVSRRNPLVENGFYLVGIQWTSRESTSHIGCFSLRLSHLYTLLVLWVILACCSRRQCAKWCSWHVDSRWPALLDEWMATSSATILALCHSFA